MRTTTGLSSDDAIRIVEERVREAVRRSGVDPLRDPTRARDVVDDTVDAYLAECRAADITPTTDRSDLAQEVLDSVVGFGPLQRFFDDPEVEEIYVDEPLGSWGLGACLWGGYVAFVCFE